MLRIKEVLKEKKKSQIDLAEALGMTTVGLNKIIKGNPTMETLLKIAEALDVDVRDLLVPTKKKESTTVFIEKEGNFIPIGEIRKFVD